MVPSFSGEGRDSGIVAASLAEPDLTDISLQLAEMRQFLIVRDQKRQELHPKLFEEVVGSVFRDLGYSVAVVGKSGDNGIDIILQKHNETIGVQVKRYKDRIHLSTVLVLAKLRKGIHSWRSRSQSN